MNEQQIKELIKDWHKNKAVNEEDPFYRFLCHWICFNAWLDHTSGQPNDKAMINWLKSQGQSSDLIQSYENMKQTTVGLQALKDFASMSPIRDARGGRPDIVIHNEHDRDGVIEGIYRIRCNLFHGGKSSTDTRDSKLLTVVNLIMTKWINDLVSGW